MKMPFEEATETQKTILSEAVKLLNFRIFDLFTGYLEALLCRDDPTATVLLHERFLWFITELKEEIRQNLEVSEIEKNTPEDSEVDAVDQYFRKSKPVFTPESYDKISTDLLSDMLKANPDFLTKLEQATEEASES